MRLLTYRHRGEDRVGVLDPAGEVIEAADLLRRAGVESVGSGSMLELLSQGPSALAALASALGQAAELRAPATVLSEVTLLAPVPRPGKILAVAGNYAEHNVESGVEVVDADRSTPSLFSKPASSVIGPGEDIVVPPIARDIDWEIELGVVIGSPARDVTVTDALDHVAGYTVVNDVTARTLDLGVDRVSRAGDAFHDFLIGKSFDTFAVLGPWIVTRDEIPDPNGLRFELRVNGELRQADSTELMIHSVAQIIAFASKVMTLEPGDVIATGTPKGTGLASGRFLQHGDHLVAEIAGLGRIENTVRSR